MENSFSKQKHKSTNPLEVHLIRDSLVESKHRVHVVICDKKGRVLMKAGDPEYETFIRSAQKPFQTIPFISSGASEKFNCGDRGIAISCSSHSGTPTHAREAFGILWKSNVEVNSLKCPLLDKFESSLQHNCSGKHAAFLATCKKMGWPLNSYLEKDHPLQVEIIRRISELLGLPHDELVVAKDDCGAPTLRLQLSQMALLYAHLGGSLSPELEKISRAMLSYPELIAGKKLFDTELIAASHGQLVSKGGAEGIQCISKVAEGMGIAIKSEDGSKRAKHAVAIHILKQLDWITPTGIQGIEQEVLKLNKELKLEVQGELGFKGA